MSSILVVINGLGYGVDHDLYDVLTGSYVMNMSNLIKLLCPCFYTEDVKGRTYLLELRGLTLIMHV